MQKVFCQAIIMPFSNYFTERCFFIMSNNDLQVIQNRIGYSFKKPDLLQQAFVRRSYAKEKGGEDNEVLEFIGDKALDIIVVKILVETFGFYTYECDDYDKEEDFDEFCCEYSEGKLTEIKKRLVSKETLANYIDQLDLAGYLIMGKGDSRNHIEQEDSVKEDLFEAIIGAVALDSGWNIAALQDVIELMLVPDTYLEINDNNHVQIIQEWTGKHSGTLPSYSFGATARTAFPVSWYPQSPKCIYDRERVGKTQQYPVCCYMKIAKDLPEFLGLGKSKSAARKDACFQACVYLENNGLLTTIRDEIENPNKDDAINQLEILARRGYFSIPTYAFEQSYDKNGNPIWKSECHIAEYDTSFWAKSTSKKDAKKSAAFKMLKYVLDE